MQFAIIKLAMTMIEQEWAASNVGNREQPYLGMFGPIDEYAKNLNFDQGNNREYVTYAYKLAVTWYWLNKLKAHY